MTLLGRIGVGVLSLLAIATSARAQVNEWWGPASGVWSDPGNWSPFGPLPPFTSTTELWVDADHFPGQNTTSTVDQSYSIFIVYVWPGDVVVVAGGVSLTLEQGMVSGLGAGGSWVLDPGGQLNLGGSFIGNGVTIPGEMRAGSRLQNLGPLGSSLQANIAGEGTISGNVSFASTETISANVAGAVLRIDAPPLKFTNFGTLNASGNGILELFGEFENTVAGNLNASGGTIALLNASTLTGGTFSASGAGKVLIGRTAAANVVLQDVTNNGTLEFRNASTLQVGTALLNNGTLLMSLFAGGTPTLNGSTYRLTNSSSGLIRGRGSLGADELEITNSGTIEANGAPGAVLVIDPPNVLDGFVNHGVLSASNNATLRLSGLGGGTIQNGLTGTMRPGPGNATIELQDGVFIDQGTFIADAGIVHLPDTVGMATLKGVTNEGTISTGANTALSIEGTFTHSGWLNIGTTASNGTATFGPTSAGNATLSMGVGLGTVTLVNELASSITGPNRLINVDAVIQGAGEIGGGTMRMTNSGTIHANVAGKVLKFTTPFGVDAFVNNGHVVASGGATIQFDGPFAIGGGTYDIQEMSGMDVNATVIFASGKLDNAGTVNLLGGSTVSFGGVNNSGVLHAAGGTLSVGTIIQSGVMVNDGTFIIDTAGTMNGGVGGNGTMLVRSATVTAQHIRQGGLDLSTGFGGSTVEIQSSGSGTIGTSKVQSLAIDFGDRLEINDNALIVEDAAALFTTRDMTLDGRITSQKPGSTAAEDAIGVAELSGTFRGQSISSVAVCVAAALRGDGDLRGTVDSVDFGFFLSGFGSTGYFTRWQYGDYNGDFAVNTGDFNYLAGNFGQTYASPALGALVPEPQSVVAVLIGVFALRRRL